MHEIAKTLVQQIVGHKQAEIDRAEEARQLSLRDAQEAEGAMISRYDTFLEEAQYLAGGQNKRLQEATEALSMLKTLLQKNPETSRRVVIGSVVSVENIETEEARYYIVVFDGCGGKAYPHPLIDCTDIYAISFISPIGKALISKAEGDEVKIPMSSDPWEITKIL